MTGGGNERQLWGGLRREYCESAPAMGLIQRVNTIPLDRRRGGRSRMRYPMVGKLPKWSSWLRG